MTTKLDVETFKGHRLWAVADSAASFAASATSRSTTDRQTLARTLAVAKYTKSFRPIEAYLFPGARISQADALASSFDSLASQLDGWDQAAAMLPATVSALDQYCDQVLAYLVDFKWPSARKGREADAFADAADAYRVVSDASLEGIEEAIEAASGRLKALEDQAADLATESGNRQTEAAAALEAISATEATQAANAQASLQAEMRKVNDAAKAQRDELAKESEELLAGLRADHETGNDLVKKVADQSVGGGYLQFALDEMESHKNWNRVGISAAIAAFVFLAVAFWGGEVKTAEASILKVGISLSLIGLSAYAFREAGKRQRQSLEARYRALDVLALPPFSKGLSEIQQQELRYLMGERLFGSSIESASSGKSSDKTTSINFAVDAGSLKTFVDTARAVKDVTG